MAKIFGLFSIPDDLQPTASPSELKNRLDWGEPALTIIDVRSREAFLEAHIMGAIAIPESVLVERVSLSLELERDIYVYGNNDEQSLAAADKLRAAGYTNVAELKGGLPAWKAIKGAIEATRLVAA